MAAAAAAAAAEVVVALVAGEGVEAASYRAGRKGEVWGEIAKAGMEHTWDKNREVADWVERTTAALIEAGPTAWPADGALREALDDHAMKVSLS